MPGIPGCHNTNSLIRDISSILIVRELHSVEIFSLPPGFLQQVDGLDQLTLGCLAVPRGEELGLVGVVRPGGAGDGVEL